MNKEQDISEKEITKVNLILNQAKMYDRMIWLGLLFYPCVIIFAIMASSTANKALYEKHTAEQRTEALKIKNGAVLGAIVLTILWIACIVLVIYVNITAMETASKIRYRY